MRRIHVVAAALALLFVGAGLSRGALIWTVFDGHKYALTPLHGTWAASEAAAVAAGGHLVSIGSAAENAFVAELARAARLVGYPNETGCNCAWIGYAYTVPPSAFGWVDGDPVTYTNHWSLWGIESGDHAYMIGNDYPDPAIRGRWGHNADWDVPGSVGNMQGVIEKVPEPGTLMLAFLGGVALLRRRRR